MKNQLTFNTPDKNENEISLKNASHVNVNSEESTRSKAEDETPRDTSPKSV